MTKNKTTPAWLMREDKPEDSNSASNQRARLLGAFHMRLPVTTENAKSVFNIPNIALRLQELRRLGCPIKTWYGSAKNTAGRSVAAFGVYPPLGKYGALTRAPLCTEKIAHSDGGSHEQE
jgi:hypothetical protein